MKVNINRIKLNSQNHPDIRADLSFIYDDRDSFRRSCRVDIDLDKQEIKGLPVNNIQKSVIDQTYNFLGEIIASCDIFSNFPAITIEF